MRQELTPFACSIALLCFFERVSKAGKKETINVKKTGIYSYSSFLNVFITRQRLLGNIHALDGLQLLQEGRDGVHDHRGGPRQSFHHVSQGPEEENKNVARKKIGGNKSKLLPACVIHEVKIVFHLEENDQGGHDLPYGEARQRVLVAHDKQLAHLDHSLQLSRFITGGLQSL